MSPGVVSISGAKDETITLVIERAQATAGESGYRGTIHSKKSGTFNISGTLIPFLAPVDAEAGSP